MSENNSANDVDGLGPLFAALAAMALAFVLFIALAYAAVFVLSAGAIYLGIKLGSNGQIGKKPSYTKVHEAEQEKQEHLAELEGESADLKELVVSKYEQEKMNLYRPADDKPEPIININADAAKEALKTGAKKVVKRAMGGKK
jgi:hypothetical protein